MGVKPTCCEDLRKLEDMDSSLYYDESEEGWMLVTDEATTIPLNYCPYCGKAIRRDIV